MSKIKKGKKKNILKNKTILIIVLLILVTILGIIFCFLHIRKTLGLNNPKITFGVTDIKDDMSLIEILEYHECTNISYSIETDKNGKLYHKIYLRFKHDLYENDKSNQEYFETIIKDLNKRLYRTYQLLDEKKGIDIWFDYETKEYTINGVKDYFKENSFEEVIKHQKIPKVNTLVEAGSVNRMISNNWKRDGLNSKEEIVSSDSEFIDYGTYKMSYTNRNINYIIFNSDYEEPIVKDIKVGTSFKEIQKVLGTPTFKNSNKMIGYKTTNIYVFFYSDKAVVYPCKDYSNYKLESLIFSFYEGNYDGYATNLVLDVLNECMDMTSEIVDEGVKLYSYVRGIEIIINQDNTLKITIYDNYNLSEQMDKYAKSGVIELKFEDDSVNLFEQKRDE